MELQAVTPVDWNIFFEEGIYTYRGFFLCLPHYIAVYSFAVLDPFFSSSLDHACSAVLFSSSSHTALSPLDLTTCQSSVFKKSDGLFFHAKYAVSNSRSRSNILLCREFLERETFTFEEFMIESNSKLHC